MQMKIRIVRKGLDISQQNVWRTAIQNLPNISRSSKHRTNYIYDEIVKHNIYMLFDIYRLMSPPLIQLIAQYTLGGRGCEADTSETGPNHSEPLCRQVASGLGNQEPPLSDACQLLFE